MSLIKNKIKFTEFIDSFQTILLILILPMYGWSRSLPVYMIVTFLFIELLRRNYHFFVKLIDKIKNFFFLYFALWFFLLLISVYFSIDQAISIKAWFRLMLYFVISLAVFDHMTRVDINKKKLADIFIYVGITGICILFIRQVFLVYVALNTDIKVGGVFWTIRHYTNLISFFIPLFIVFWPFIKKDRSKLIATILFSVLFLAIAILNQSRTALLSLITILLFATAINYKKISTWVIVCLISAIIFLFSTPLIFYKKIKHFITIDSAHSYLPNWLIDPHRQAIWEFCYKQLANLPFFGFGPNTSVKIPGADRLIPWMLQGGNKAFVFLYSSPHNFIFELLLDNGWILTIYFLFGLFLRAIYLFQRLGSKYIQAELFLHLGFFSAFMVNLDIYKTIQFVPVYLVTLAMVLGLQKNSNIK